ncbi:MAG: DUF4330 domain-containing protein [Candidatus Omnitrophota bacterium]
MKIIDEKGRLFGKINIIDFLVILFLIGMLPMFYFGYKGYKLFSKKSIVSVEQPKLTEVEIRCRFVKLSPQVAKAIAVGDKELNQEGKVMMEVIQLEAIEPYRYEFDIGGGKLIYKEDPLLKQISGKIRIEATILNVNQLYYKDQPVALNSKIDFETDKYDIQAVIIPEEEKNQLKEVWVRLKLKSKTVIPELSRIIKEEDVEKDPSGKTVVIIEKILSNELSEISTMTMKDNNIIFIEGTSPYYYDTVLLAKVLCVEKDGVLYFKNYPVKIGNTITVTTELYSLPGTIIGLEIE